jgi:hypothetical protein
LAEADGSWVVGRGEMEANSDAVAGNRNAAIVKSCARSASSANSSGRASDVYQLTYTAGYYDLGVGLTQSALRFGKGDAGSG